MCESCSQAEMNSVVPRYELIVECNACAEACFDLVLGLLNNADDIGDFPFRCIVHCRQCIEECRKYPANDVIHVCIAACTACAITVKELTAFALN